MTHSPRAYPPALLLLSAAAHARPRLAADFAPRTPNESMPRRKHFTPPLVNALHARDQPTTRPPTRARTEPAGAAAHAHLPTTNPEPIGVQQHHRCRSYNDTTVHGEALQVCNNKITQNRPSGIAIVEKWRWGPDQ